MLERERPLGQLIRKLATHSALSPQSREAIHRLPHRIRDYEPHSYALREGDKPDRCYVLFSGFAFRHKLTGQGARQILSLHIPGDPLDFQNIFLDEGDHNVQMLTRAEVAEIPRAALQDIVAREPEVARAILIYTLVEASIFREWSLNIGRRDARTRIAHFLCEFAYRMNAQGLHAGGVFELPMTQEQIADATALTPVHVNRVLKALHADGLIERNRRVVHFPDWRMLQDVADFNSRYLHGNMD